MGGASSRICADCQPAWRKIGEHRPRRAVDFGDSSKEHTMTDTPIDPAATPEDDDRPEIAADDAGASALAEAAQKKAEDDAEEDDK